MGHTHTHSPMHSPSRMPVICGHQNIASTQMASYSKPLHYDVFLSCWASVAIRMRDVRVGCGAGGVDVRVGWGVQAVESTWVRLVCRVMDLS